MSENCEMIIKTKTLTLLVSIDMGGDKWTNSRICDTGHGSNGPWWPHNPEINTITGYAELNRGEGKKMI